MPNRPLEYIAQPAVPPPNRYHEHDAPYAVERRALNEHCGDPGVELSVLITEYRTHFSPRAQQAKADHHRDDDVEGDRQGPVCCSDADDILGRKSRVSADRKYQDKY